jgi:hypothetical protein
VRWGSCGGDIVAFPAGLFHSRYKAFSTDCEPFHGVDSIDNAQLIESTDHDTGDIYLKARPSPRGTVPRA